MSLSSIASILRNKPGGSAMARGVMAAHVVEAGNKALIKMFGATIADHAQCAHYKNRELAVACLSSVVAQEIRLQEGRFISLIDENLGQKQVERIKYII